MKTLANCRKLKAECKHYLPNEYLQPPANRIPWLLNYLTGSSFGHNFLFWWQAIFGDLNWHFEVSMWSRGLKKGKNLTKTGVILKSIQLGVAEINWILHCSLGKSNWNATQSSPHEQRLTAVAKRNRILKTTCFEPTTYSFQAAVCCINNEQFIYNLACASS